MSGEAERLEGLFRRQADAEIMRASPLYVVLLHHSADDLAAGGVLLELLHARAGERRGQALPLRFMAALHRLALTGEAPELAAHLPSTGGDGDADGAWTALLELVARRGSLLDELLSAPLQTNEPGRSRSLISGLLAVAARTRRPLRLLEVGASAGLNLNLMRYRFDAGASVVGDPDSALRFTCAAWPAPLPRLTVAEASGCDAQPLDPRSAADQLTLRSAVWADQPGRLKALDAALAIAAAHPPCVERAELTDWIAGLSPQDGTATVVFHSVVEQYLAPPARERLAAEMARLLGGASSRAPVAWLSLERAVGEGSYGKAELRLALSPDPQRRLLGHVGYHGSPLELAQNLDEGTGVAPSSSDTSSTST